MIEPGISIAAFLVIFYGGIVGAREGLFRALARFGFGLFGLIFAMRWWYPGTLTVAEWLTVKPEQVSFAVFWAVYAVVLLPFSAMLKSLNHDFLPDYPALLERFVGFFFGAANAAILSSAILLSVTLNLPRLLPGYDEARLLLPLQRFPEMIYRPVEKTLAAPGPLAQSRTVLPVLEKDTPDSALRAVWK